MSLRNTIEKRAAQRKLAGINYLPKKAKPDELPNSVENGCVIVSDDVTEEQLRAIRTTD